MKKLLLVLLSLVSLFSLTSCDILSDLDDIEDIFDFDNISDIFDFDFGFGSTTTGCPAEGEYYVRRVEVYSYWNGNTEIYHLGDYYYGMWLSEDTIRVSVDRDGNVEGRAYYSQYDIVHFYGYIQEAHEGDYFMINLHEPCDFGFNIEPYYEMYIQQYGDEYEFRIYTASGEFIYYLEKR